MKTYQTQDTALALTLETCGVPFFKDESGEPRPFVHIYTPQILRKLGYRGMRIEEAARQAVEKGQNGIVVYNFERTELCEQIIQAYHKHSEAIAVAEAANRPLETRIEINPIDAARFACQLLRNRRNHTPAKLCQAIAPYICMMGEMKTETEGDKTVTVGSFKLIPLNASKELRRELNL